MPHQQHLFGPLGCGGHSLTVGRSQGHRFFAKDMLFGPEGLHHDFSVQRGGKRNVDDINAIVCQ